MKYDNFLGSCGRATHFHRRTLLKAGAIGGLSWLTPLSHCLARDEEQKPRRAKPKSVIVLWLQGGPSQIETFDPKPGSKLMYGKKAISTTVPGIQLGQGMEQIAEQMESIALIRSVTSKEGDHERAVYNMKTGFRPDPTAVHPALGAILCHQLKDSSVEIPRHVSILPGQWPARGGYLGDIYDAFKVNDPRGPVPDVNATVPEKRQQRRLSDLKSIVEVEFARGRLKNLESRKTLHLATMDNARKMMSSDQLKAFNVSEESKNVRDRYGDSAFGRGCLAALRLIGAGVRCVEVTLSGWDSHVNNNETQSARIETLDPAFAALIHDLKERDLFDSTVVLCGGEFGRTPTMNPGGGRDHWPHGFSVAVAGGCIRGGIVLGETASEEIGKKDDPLNYVNDPRPVEDIHATVLHALGVDFEKIMQTPIGRTLQISPGQVIEELLNVS